MIEIERMIEHFIRLAKIDSLSLEEREVAEVLIAELKTLGATVFMDDAGSRIGGNCGNIIATLPGTIAGDPVLLSAHMDTVVPGRGIQPIREKDRIHSDGSTILGADDKSGIAIIMEVLRVLKERDLPHPPIEIVFTVCEEAGLVGAKQMHPGKLSARNGLVLDCDRADSLFIRGPAADRIEVTVHGLAAHAGVCPEKGISAIQVAAEALAKMRLGRLDAETTANIGLIEGGRAINIVPETVVVKGEARSHDERRLAEQSAHMAECFHSAAAGHRILVDGEEKKARVETRVERDYNRMNLGEDAPIVHWVMEASRRLGVGIACRQTGGGCDANVFNQHGLNVANLGTGMRDIHTLGEYLLLGEFEQTARVVLETLKIAAGK